MDKTLTALKLAEEALEYRDGILYWKVKPSINKNIWDAAGCINGDGYLQTSFKNRRFLNHRLIFLMHNRYLPQFIDHIDGDRLNNKIDNLREATASQNSHNSKVRVNNKSGIKGVYFHKKTGKWAAGIRCKGKHIHIGLYEELKEAGIAVQSAREQTHKEFTRHE